MPLFLTISVEPLYWVPFVSKNNSLSLSLPLYSGGPGSGKGTQSLKIAERYGFQYMSVGELLRKKMIHNATSNRKWSLIETTITEIKQKIMKIPDANGIVIDGFPRDVGQALSFEDQICTPDLVVFLACTNSRLKERLQKRAEQQGRPDDNPKAIDRRLTNFKQNTIPLVKYFQERGLIVTLDASGIPVAVRGLVQKHIDQISICAR
uniref:Uncharacterized protein n=1 Tax=Poecilia mexicana TaxID=48701 RepID=A0A3B3Y0P3_9TELE